MEDNSEMSAIVDGSKGQTDRQADRQTNKYMNKNIMLVTAKNISQTHSNQCQCYVTVATNTRVTINLVTTLYRKTITDILLCTRIYNNIKLALSHKLKRT